MIDTSGARRTLSGNEQALIAWFNEHGIEGKLEVQTNTRTRFALIHEGEEVRVDLPTRLSRVGDRNIKEFISYHVEYKFEPTPVPRTPTPEEINSYAPGKWTTPCDAAITNWVKKYQKINLTLYIVAEYEIEAGQYLNRNLSYYSSLDNINPDYLDRVEEAGHPLLVTDNKSEADEMFKDKKSCFYKQGGILYRRGFFFGEYEVKAPEYEDEGMPDIEYVGISDAPVQVGVYDRHGDAAWYEDGELIGYFDSYVDADIERAYCESRTADDEEEHDFHIR